MLERIRQFREAGRGPSDDDIALASRYLPSPLLALYSGQEPRDMGHAAATARWLIERNHADPELVQAALLHDIGKGRQRRFDRVGWVAAEQLRLGRVLADKDSKFELRRALARSAGHSEAGARMLAEAGAARRVVELTRLHHSAPRGDRVLALLQQADAVN